jgi:hypothetical protein
MHHDQESKHQEGRKYVHPAECCSVSSFWLEPFKPDVWHQWFGKENASVWLLPRLQQSSHGAPYGETRPIQGVNQLGLFAVFGSDGRSAGLEISANAAAGDFSEGSSPR